MEPKRPIRPIIENDLITLFNNAFNYEKPLLLVNLKSDFVSTVGFNVSNVIKNGRTYANKITEDIESFCKDNRFELFGLSLFIKIIKSTSRITLSIQIYVINEGRQIFNCDFDEIRDKLMGNFGSSEPTFTAYPSNNEFDNGIVYRPYQLKAIENRFREGNFVDVHHIYRYAKQLKS